MRSLKRIRTSATTWSVTMDGNWGNPSLGGGDFGTIFFDIVMGTQGAIITPGRSLKFDNFNNSYISPANSSFTLKYTENVAFDSVTMSDYNGATEGSSLGEGKWYTYEVPGGIKLVSNFVMYISDGTVVYAFEATGTTSQGTDDHNQGSYTFEVKQL